MENRDHHHHKTHALHTLAANADVEICVNCGRCEAFLLDKACPVAVTLAQVQETLGTGNTAAFCDHYGIDLGALTEDEVAEHQGVFRRMVARLGLTRKKDKT